MIRADFDHQPTLSADALLTFIEMHERNANMIRLITEPDSHRRAGFLKENAAIEEVLRLIGWVPQ